MERSNYGIDGSWAGRRFFGSENPEPHNERVYHTHDQELSQNLLGVKKPQKIFNQDLYQKKFICDCRQKMSEKNVL